MSTTDLPQIDEKRAVNLVLELIGVPGRSTQENQIVATIRQKLLAAGVPEASIKTDTANKRSGAGGEVGNLVVKIPGTFRGPRRMLLGHVDTVPLCVGSKPFIDGELIRSRDPKTALGGDDRAGACVVLNAILEILRQGLPHPPLTLLWPVQEEIGLQGVRHMSVKGLGNPKLCFNWDGGPPGMAVVGAVGHTHMDIAIDGIASHAGGHPELGVNAAVVAAIAVADLQANGWHGLVQKGKNRGSSNVGIFHGGDATNVVMPRVTLQAEARSHNAAFRDRIVREFKKAFARAAKSITSAVGGKPRLTFETDVRYEALRLDKTEACVVSALKAVERVGLSPETRICDGGLDANWLTAHGFPTVTLGCGQAGIHTVNETLHVPSFLNACRIGLLLATGGE